MNANGEITLNQQIRPLLHVDFHGKYPKTDPKMRDYMTDIDIGHQSMMQYWRNKSDTDMITEEIGNVFASHLSEIYKKELVGPYKIRPELDPYLHGFWGPDLHTMTS